MGKCGLTRGFFDLFPKNQTIPLQKPGKRCWTDNKFPYREMTKQPYLIVHTSHWEMVYHCFTRTTKMMRDWRRERLKEPYWPWWLSVKIPSCNQTCRAGKSTIYGWFSHWNLHLHGISQPAMFDSRRVSKLRIPWCQAQVTAMLPHRLRWRGRANADILPTTPGTQWFAASKIPTWARPTKLVGGIPTPLKNIKVNWDDYSQ